MSELMTVTIAVTSGVAVAVVSAVLARAGERERQLRERRMAIAGDFAGAAMGTLARLRHVKPTKGADHRNHLLHADDALRLERERAVAEALDEVRRMRGHVWLLLPGRSGLDARRRRRPVTASDWAEQLVADLRETETTCRAFWRECARASPDERTDLEAAFDDAYDLHKGRSWADVDGFADAAHKVLVGKRARRSRRLDRSERSTGAGRTSPSSASAALDRARQPAPRA